MKKSILTIFAVPLFIIPPPESASATDTIICISPKYEVQIHVGSENTLADIVVHDGNPHELKQEELEEVKLKWIKSVPPFDGSSLTVRRKETTKSRFFFSLEVTGGSGKLRTTNGESELECDWTR